jgi:hypothetical protein
VILAITRLRPRRCLLELAFFGLTPEYINHVYEQFFQLKYYGGWSFFEAYNLPVKLRRWFLKKLADQIKKEGEQQKLASQRAKSKSKKKY